MQVLRESASDLAKIQSIRSRYGVESHLSNRISDKFSFGHRDPNREICRNIDSKREMTLAIADVRFSRNVEENHDAIAPITRR